MSIVTYNGITFPYATTTFSQEAVYDDLSNTDRCYTKFDVTVIATLNANYLPLIAPDLVVAGKPVTDNAALIMSIIRSRLLQPRKTLSITFNGVELIPQRASVVGTVDARNGPQPQYCNVTDLKTNVSFLFTWRVVAHYWENNSVNPGNNSVSNKSGNNVLFNRWSETQDIDILGMSKRIREGKFVIRSDNLAGQIVDQFRAQFAVLGVNNGCLRESAKYTVTPDGLALQYVIIDREVYKMPPNPAYEAQGYYTETATKNMGYWTANVRVKLRGAKTVNQADMVSKAIAICGAKLLYNSSRIAPSGKAVFKGLITSAITRVNMYENEVECIMDAIAPGARLRTSGINGFTGTAMTYTPGSDDANNGQQPPDYPVYGTASLLLQAAAYYDPSLKGVVLSQKNNQMTKGLEVGEAGVIKEP